MTMDTNPSYLNYYPYGVTGTGTPTPGYNYPSPATNYRQVTPTVNVVWVSDDSYVATYPVGQNSAVVLWDYAHKKIFLKQADASGKPSVTTYSVTEDEVPKANNVEGSSKYVSEESFAKLQKDIKEELEAIKKDMYGVMGKKKTSHDKEE